MKIYNNGTVKKIALFLTSVYITTSNFFMSYASETDLENTKLITGTKSLLSVATGILTGHYFGSNNICVRKERINMAERRCKRETSSQKKVYFGDWHRNLRYNDR